MTNEMIVSDIYRTVKKVILLDIEITTQFIIVQIIY